MRGGRGKQMKALEGEEDRLLREIEALQNQLIGVRRAMALSRGDDPEKITLGAARKPRKLRPRHQLRRPLRTLPPRMPMHR